MSFPAPFHEPDYEFPPSTKTCLSTIGWLREGLQIPCTQPPLPGNSKLSTRVHALFHPLIADHLHSQQPDLTETLNTAILNTLKIYPLHPLDTQVYISVQIFFHDYIREHLFDSRPYNPQHDLRAILTQLGAGWPSIAGLQDKLLEFYINYVRKETKEFFEPKLAGEILEEAMNLVLERLLEWAREHERTGVEHDSDEEEEGDSDEETEAAAKNKSKPKAEEVEKPDISADWPWNAGEEMHRAFLFPKALFPGDVEPCGKQENDAMRVWTTCVLDDLVELYKYSLLNDEAQVACGRMARERMENYGCPGGLEHACELAVEQWKKLKELFGDGMKWKVWEAYASGLLSMHFEK